MMRSVPWFATMFGGRAERVCGRLAALVAGVCLMLVVLAPGSAGAFALKPGSFKITPSSGQAGAHADLTTAFKLVHNAEGATHGNLKTTTVELPAGFVGSDTAVPTCTPEQLDAASTTGAKCPPDTQVGTISFSLALFAYDPFGVPVTEPLYNMEVTNPDIAAMFGFSFNGIIVQNIVIRVRPGDLGLTVTSEELQGLGEVSEVSVTVWGVPAEAGHDAERGRHCSNGVCEGGGETVDSPVRPLLANPTSCTGEPFTATLRTNDWQQPEEYLSEQAAIAPVGECERVPFEPSIEVQPTTRSAESPSGLDVSLLNTQSWENPISISTSDLKDATVTLPEGFTVNPGAGSGLGACTPAQYASETAQSQPGEGCPPESKIGSIEIETPLLSEKIQGAVYIATPYDNPFGSPEHPGGSLLALYIVAKDPFKGIVIKVAGKLEPNPVTGRLTSTFLNNPQQPFSRFTLKFRPGATAPLVSPPTCGTYTTGAALTPWSAPGEARLLSSSFEITQGVHEGACPLGGVPPFKPQVISGTQNNAGGSYSPFYLRILREDGEQELTRFSTTLPPGLTGNLSGIPFCPEADIEAARGVSGAEEEANPSCPQASEIGHTIVSAGVGTVLAQTPGKVYLAGAYHGAPLSIVSITSAKVGPFDLGTVVIRFALNINPTTAQVEVSGAQSDPIPHIIDGIVVHVREIRVYMNKEKFIINPTNCNPLGITDTIDGAGADFTNPADQVPVAVNTPFEAADCSSLTFKPDFSVSTSGKTSKADGASLNVNLTMPGALGSNANIHQVKVELPQQLPSRLTTLQKACTKAQFDTNPAGCPAASVVGYARAVTPILPVPIEGPAYFVSNGAEAFPNLILVLQGYGITIDLVGDTFISKQGITSSTFKTVPDQPVSSFELTLPQGPFSALTANGNLCALTKTITVKKKVTLRTKNGRKRTTTKNVKQSVPASLSMPTEFVAQNGAVLHQTTSVTVTGCPKAKPAKRKTRSAKKAKKARRKG
ncbi:MAG TPA: hypothetical protein VG053_09165 [Solirubrobacteraceae bacterium]|jgi:hypothetical protein|nr:hypothetical protein [Solirubrobacteraceae bacterium]